jgi:hypothetical protein
MQKKKKNKIKKEKKSKIFLIILIMLLILLCLILLAQFQEKDFFKDPFKEPELFVIQDECSAMFNSIIHEIKDESECRLYCRNECEIREKEIHHSEFIESQNSCHTCNCYCE